MLIVNRTPTFQMRNDVSQLFSSMFNGLPSIATAGQANVPAMNVWEKDQAFFIEAELPGFSMSDIDVSVLGTDVTVSGERKQCDFENATYLRRERNCGAFSRTWSLPAEVDVERVEASLKNGILLITLPKSAKAQPRRIEVRTAAH